jgi:hypothetical protein
LDDNDDKAKVFDGIALASTLDVVAYFGHGTTDGLSSADVCATDTGALATAISKSATSGCRIVLYACSVGVRGGFAETLAGLVGNGSVVYGHTTIGHSYCNPNVTYYPNSGDQDAPFLIGRQNPRWRVWVQRMRDTDLWMRFPFMSKQEIEAELAPKKEQGGQPSPVGTAFSSLDRSQQRRA